jgi:hypothetical protein
MREEKEEKTNENEEKEMKKKRIDLYAVRGSQFPQLRGGLISLWLYKENNKLRD